MRKYKNKNKINVKIDILSPTTIGIGQEYDWREGLDYMIDWKNKTLYQYDIVNVVNYRKENDAAVFIANISDFLLSNDTNEILKVLGSIHQIKDNSNLKIRWNSKTAKPNRVKPCLRNQLNGKPIIPGSSIKGAITSILMSEWKEPAQDIDRKLIMGDSVKGTDFGRFIRISDFEFPLQSSEIINTIVFNLSFDNKNKIWEAGWKHRKSTDAEYREFDFNTLYECLIKSNNSWSVGTISIEKELYKNLPQEENQETQKRIQNQNALLDDPQYPDSEPIENLFYLINKRMKKYLDKEIAFFTKYGDNIDIDIVNYLKRLKTYVYDDENKDYYVTKCLLRIGTGSGFHSVTGDWKFNDYCDERVMGRGTNNRYLNNLPKSRKIAIRNGQFLPMGFVKLSLVEE